MHHSNLLWYKSALLYPKETEQVPKTKHGWLLPQGCFKDWISQPSHFSLVLCHLPLLALSLSLCRSFFGFNLQCHSCLHRSWRLKCKAHTLHVGATVQPLGLPGQEYHSWHGPQSLLWISSASSGRSPASPLLSSSLQQHVPLQESMPQ